MPMFANVTERQADQDRARRIKPIRTKTVKVCCDCGERTHTPTTHSSDGVYRRVYQCVSCATIERDMDNL